MPANEKNNLISIIMPAFNAEKYISAAIESVVKQKYKNWELIIVDDASTDNTLSVIEKWMQKDERIILYKNIKNLGVSHTRNKAISLSSGKWIAFLDSDDIWVDSKLENQMNYIYDHNINFVFTGSSYINELGSAYKGTFQVPKFVSYESLKKHNVISCSSVLINKKYFENIKMEDDSIHEDYATWLTILKDYDENAYGINEPLLIYRISKGSKSGNKIKTFRMTYKVYRFIGLNRIKSVYYLIHHIYNSIKKYNKIKQA